MQSDWQRGKLVKWNDDRGFGFIQPENQSQEIFLHVSDVDRSIRAPRVGDIILYQTVSGKQGKLRASFAKIEGATAPKALSQTLASAPAKSPALKAEPGNLSLEIGLLVVLPIVGSIHFTLTQRNPLPLLLYPIMSAITYILYQEDKSRAQQQRWRISENTLHLLELCGGWSGAYVAQRLLRHKSSKPSYQFEFCVIIAIHLVGWIAWFILQMR